jgi:hypothetical protein
MAGFFIFLWGCMLLTFTLRAFVMAWRSKYWTPVTATIIAADVGIVSTGSVDAAAIVKCQFAVGDNTYVCSLDSIASQVVSRSQAERMLAHYPIGSQVVVYYDPKNPKNSVRHPGLNFGSFFTVFGSVFFVGIGLYIMRYHKG